MAIGARATGAAATGSAATGSAAIGALAVGALAVGAAAIGALAIGRLAVGRARFGRIEIGELAVGRLTIGGREPAPSAIARIRARPGQGDAVERLLLDHALPAATNEPAVPFCRVQRSVDDPDLFLLLEHHAGQVAVSPLEALRRRLIETGLVVDGAEAASDVERYRTIPIADAAI